MLTADFPKGLRQKPAETLEDHYRHAEDLLHALQSMDCSPGRSVEEVNQQLVHEAIEFYILGLLNISLQCAMRSGLGNEGLGAYYFTLYDAYRVSQNISRKLKAQPSSIADMIASQETVQGDLEDDR